MFLLQDDADIHMAKFQVIVTLKKGYRTSRHKTADFAVLGKCAVSHHITASFNIFPFLKYGVFIFKDLRSLLICTLNFKDTIATTLTNSMWYIPGIFKILQNVISHHYYGVRHPQNS